MQNFIGIQEVEEAKIVCTNLKNEQEHQFEKNSNESLFEQWMPKFLLKLNQTWCKCTSTCLLLDLEH